MATDVQTGTITTQVPARLDRLPWSRFHRRVVIGWRRCVSSWLALGPAPPI
ncbi:major facilitator family transporter [Mycobacterium xenopi 3993]|nr:major facilitator family transporter [Mycobacterium xenopi 3993]